MATDSNKESPGWRDDPLAPFESFDLDASFGANDERVFRNADGSPAWTIDDDGRHAWPDLDQLATLGRSAIREIRQLIEIAGGATLAATVKYGLSEIEGMRREFLQMADTAQGKIEVKDRESGATLVSSEAIDRIEDADSCAILKMGIEFIRQAPPELFSEETRSQFRFNGYCACLREIDYTLRSLRQESGDSVCHAIAAMECWQIGADLADSNTVRERVLSDWGRKARRVALKSDPKQSEKQFVKECWLIWQADPTRYASKAAFARDVREKCTYLESTKVIEDWCRTWESEPNALNEQCAR